MEALASPMTLPAETRQEESFSILQISTKLQSDLIRQLNVHASLESMLDTIMQQVELQLRPDACSLYILENHAHLDAEERVARMRAARGYHEVGLKKGASCRVILPGRVVARPADPKDKLGLTGWVISTGLSFLAKSPEAVITHSHWRGEYDAQQLPERDLKLSAFLGVPIRDLQGRIIGGLKAERLEEHDPFSIQDQITLEAMARVAGRCITYYENANKGDDFTGGIDAAIVSWSLDVIHEADATEGEVDAFLDIAVRVAAAVAQADGCSIFLIDDESRKALTQRAGCGNQMLRKGIRAYMLPDAEKLAMCRNQLTCDPPNCKGARELKDAERLGLTVWVAVTGKSFYARNYEELHKHCHHRGQFDPVNFQGQQICGAWLGMPLRVGGTVIGVLKVENIALTKDQTERVFPLHVRQRFDVLASEIALSIRRLQIQSPDRYKVIQKAMPTTIAILQGGFDMPDLVKKVVQETARLFDARACALFLKEGNELVQAGWGAYGWAGLGKKQRRYRLIDPGEIKDNPKPEEKVGLTVWIAVKQTKFTAKSNLELMSHPHHRGSFDKWNFQSGEKCESFMGVPLLLNEGKELVGVLKVETKQKVVEGGKEFSYFNEQDELVFDLIANIAAIAIQNARLLEPRRLSERLITQPSQDLVFRELHRFVAGREDVLNTLDETAQILQSQSENRAKLVRLFAGLLDERFPERILVDIRNEVPEPLKEALSLFLAALRVNSVADISHLDQRLKQQEIGGLLSSNFFLHEAVQKIYDLLTVMGDDLNEYLDRPDKTALLVKNLSLLTAELEAIADEYRFERIILGRILGRWCDVIREALKAFQIIPNPYQAGRPLEPDSEVFVGREEIFGWLKQYICDTRDQTALVIHGGWHTGKTSILKQILSGGAGEVLRGHKQKPIFPVFVDLQGIPDPGTGMFLFNVAEAICDALQEKKIDCPRPEEEDYAGTRFYREFRGFLKKVVALLKQNGKGVLVLMLDEFELLDIRVQDQKIEREIFNFLRSIVQHQERVVLILAGRHRLEQMSPEFNESLLNVSQHKEVGFLSKEESLALIRKPVADFAVTYTNEVVDEIIRLTGGQPYFIQQICWKCIDLLNEKRESRDVTRTVLDEAVNTVVRNNPILEDLWKREIDGNARQILRALVDWGKGSARTRPMPESEIARRTGLPADVLAAALDVLTVKQLIGRKEDGYVFVIQMLADWIKRNA